MEGQLAALRAHPAVVASVVAAGIAVTVAAFVAIAYMVGWVPARAPLAAPVGIANPAQQSTGIATDLALSPGESIVTAPPAAQPVTPSYAKPQPAAPKSAPAKPQQQKFSAPARPAAAPRPAASPPQQQAAHCVNCGSIAAITGYGRGEWDVRVRFQDGTSEVLRYRETPPFRLGDRVRLREGMLVRE